MEHERKLKCELYHDSMQSWKSYAVPKAQLIICDIPFNIGTDFYGSNPMWYNGGDNKNGESKFAKSMAFYSDQSFNLSEFWHFAGRLLKKEPKQGGQRGRSSDAPCMIVFCSFEQMNGLIEIAKRKGFAHYIPLFFVKNYSPQVLKANMRVVGATEHALLFYRGRLPKFRNDGKMIFNWFRWEPDGKEIPKIHPTQKPVNLMKKLITIFTDPYDVVIDVCFGSGSTARACIETGRNFYGFEISKEFYIRAKNEMCNLNYALEREQIEGQITMDAFLASREGGGIRE